MNAIAFGEHDIELIGIGQRRFTVVQQLEQVLSRVGAFDVEEEVVTVVAGCVLRVLWRQEEGLVG